jgi:geranylgeranyl pyrophosphate synthase
LTAIDSQPEISLDYDAHWQACLDRFQVSLKSFLDQELAAAPLRLADAVRYSVMAPGKRLRPILAIWANQAVGGDFSEALPAAIAVELIHAYSLIHDDLPAMDDDDLRRGRPTCHIQFDEATAILAGDALQPLAFSSLASGIRDPQRSREAIQKLAWAAGPTALVGGQMEDLRAEREGGDGAHLESIHARKTGAMIECSVALGGIVSGATSDEIRRLEAYGKSLGLAFQIIDDLLDIQGNTAELGKTVGKDSQQDKLTYPRIYGMEASRAAARDYTERAVQAAESFGRHGYYLVQLAKRFFERTR